MKYNKIRCITFITFVVLITTILVPNVFSKHSDEGEENGEEGCIGIIMGYTQTSYCWSWNPQPLALVRLGSRLKLSGINGFFSFSGLMLGRPYKITAHKFGYYPDSEIVTLTLDNPVEYIYLDLQPVFGNLFQSSFLLNNSIKRCD